MNWALMGGIDPWWFTTGTTDSESHNAMRPGLEGSSRARGKEFLMGDYLTQMEGAGRWLLRTENLEPLERFPALPRDLPEDLLLPQRQGMTVQTVVSRHDGKRWVLRWETLPRNHDKAPEKIPPATELRLYQFPDTETSNATLTGS